MATPTRCTLFYPTGFFVMALPLGFAGLCVGLVLAGIGSSIQHPRGSLLVTDTYAPAARNALGIYNFSGDLGKATLPAVAALLLPILAWRPVVGLMALLGLIVASALFALAPQTWAPSTHAQAVVRGPALSGFALLMTIGAFDTAARMGYLLFLPFLIHARGGASPAIGLGLALLFVGGAFGKATCTWLGERLGVIGIVVATEAATALLIVATLLLLLTPKLFVLPLLGVALNGTSSILYGTVPDLSEGRQRSRLCPFLYRRHWSGRLGAHRLWRHRRSQQPDRWCRRCSGDRRAHCTDGDGLAAFAEALTQSARCLTKRDATAAARPRSGFTLIRLTPYFVLCTTDPSWRGTALNRSGSV